MVGRSDHSDALSHGSSEPHAPDFLGMVHAPMLLQQPFAVGSLPMFGVTPATMEDDVSSRKRKSVQEAPSDWQEDEDSSPEDAFSTTRPRVAWTVNNCDTWFRIFDVNMNELPQPGFRVEVDKGFKHSTEGEGWICQKKNHFQVRCCSCVCLLTWHLCSIQKILPFRTTLTRRSPPP